MFEYQDENIINGSYRFYAQVMTTRYEINPSTESFLVSLHEYTHYLQSMTTIYGIITFCDLIRNHIQILFSIASSKAKPPYVKCDSQELKQLLSKRSDLIKSYLPCNAEIQFADLPCNSEFKFISDDLYIADHITKCWILITHSVIRENMSKMAEWVIKKRLHQLNSEELVKKIKPQYYIIYSYIKKHNRYDVEALTYLVCELSLMSIEPVKRLHRLLTLIEKTDRNLSIKDMSLVLMDDHTDKEDQSYINHTEKYVDQLLLYSEKHSDDIEYFQFISIFCSIFKKALDFRKTKITLLTSFMDAMWINNCANEFGSPLIFDKYDKPYFLGNDDYDRSFFRVTFYAVTVLLDICIDDSNLTRCPFYLDNKICNLKYDDKVCLDNPYEVLNDKRFQGCILQNALTLLGIQDEK